MIHNKMVSKKIIVYIDGSNMYFSVKNTFNCKIDFLKFCKKLAGKNELVKIKYYIAPVGESDSKIYAEQQKFFEKLKQIDKLELVFGRLEKHKKDGNSFYVEKATDVNLTLDILLDAFDNEYDEAYLVSNDGDFSGVVSAVIERFKKKIVYVAIGNRKSISYHLKKVSSRTLNINEDFIREVLVNLK